MFCCDELHGISSDHLFLKTVSVFQYMPRTRDLSQGPETCQFFQVISCKLGLAKSHWCWKNIGQQRQYLCPKTPAVISACPIKPALVNNGLSLLSKLHPNTRPHGYQRPLFDNVRRDVKTQRTWHTSLEELMLICYNTDTCSPFLIYFYSETQGVFFNNVTR